MRKSATKSWSLSLLTILALGGAAATSATPALAQDTEEKPPITINGVIEANYTFNFNEPSTNNNTFLYNYKEGQLALNLAQITIAKAATPSSRAGFTLRLVEGEVKEYNFLPDDKSIILEAYGTFLAPFGDRDLKVDVGQFVTHVGYETIDVGTNNFFSRNFLFQYPSPFYNAGIRAAYPLSDKVTVTGVLYNRYNGRNDSGNRDIAPGFQVLANLSGSSQLILNGLASRENLGSSDAPNNKQQNVLDLIYSNQFTPSFKFVTEGLYRWGKDANDMSYDVWGVAGYFLFNTGGGSVAGLRAEYLKQNDATTVIGLPESDFDIGSVTLTYDMKTGLFPGMRTLFEYRYDFAKDPFFGGKNGLKDSQSTLTVGQIYAF